MKVYAVFKQALGLFVIVGAKGLILAFYPFFCVLTELYPSVFRHPADVLRDPTCWIL